MIRLRLLAICDDPECEGGPSAEEYWGDSPPLTGVYACPATPDGWSRVLFDADDRPTTGIVRGGTWLDLCPKCIKRRRERGEEVPEWDAG